MREIKLNVFKFDELPEAIQEKVLNRFRENNDNPFLEDSLYDLLYNKLIENGIEYIPTVDNKGGVKLLYSLSYSQGDGCCFTGTFKYLNKVDEEAITVYIKHRGNYTHSNSVEFSFEDSDGNELMDVESFKDLYLEICKEIEKAGYEEIEYNNSDECIKETIAANDYEFYDDGTIV
jgi:hypothetical protein